MIDALIKIKDLEKIYLAKSNYFGRVGGEPRIFWFSFIFFL